MTHLPVLTISRKQMTIFFLNVIFKFNCYYEEDNDDDDGDVDDDNDRNGSDNDDDCN